VTELPIYPLASGFQDTLTSARAEARGSDVGSECDLIERAKRDPRAFAELYRRHYATVAGYVYRRISDVHRTEDLVAETFVAAMRALPRYRHRGTPIQAWFYRIATNTVNRWARRDRHRLVRGLDECSPCDTSATTSVTNEPANLEHARTALLSLKPKHQAVLALHYLEQMSVEEVAAVIGCRVGTVKSRLSRAREALRDRLTRGR
jgi:RNA polymerase sigma-70 factor (ECF subfamily)